MASLVGPVEVADLSHAPTEFWEQEKAARTVMRFKVKTPKEPTRNDKVGDYGYGYLITLIGSTYGVRTY